MRREKSKPRVAALKTWLERQLARVSAKAPIAEDIRYGLNHWDGLTRFLDDGRIELDTNIVERGIRPIVLNRKNALFAGHDEGAANWACIASLIECCKLNDVDPQAYQRQALLSLARCRSRRRGLGIGGHCEARQSCGAEASQEDHEEIRPPAEDRYRRASRLLCGDERGRQRRSPGGRSPAQQSRGEFTSAVSTTRARHAALSKREDIAEIQLSSRPGPQPFQSRAPSDHPPSLQAETLCFIGRVARPRGLNCRLRVVVLRHALTTCRYSDKAAPAGSVRADGRRIQGRRLRAILPRLDGRRGGDRAAGDGVCRPKASAAGSRSRLKVDQRQEALALARRRLGWLRSRRFGSKPQGSARGGEAVAQTHPQTSSPPAGYGHRQSRPLWRGSGGNADELRASPTQRPEQPGGELTFADEATREDHEAVQICPSSPEICLHSRPDRQPPQLSPPHIFIARISSASFRGDVRMARDRRTGHHRMNRRASRRSYHARCPTS